MKIKMHYTVNDFKDSIVIFGETVEDIQAQVKIEMEKRGLDEVKNDCWSEELIDE